MSNHPFKQLAFVVALFCLALPVIADEQPTSAVPKGKWIADCDAWGVAAICQSDWQTGLTSDMVTQSYQILNAKDNSLIFGGRGVYKQTENGIKGLWEDTGGALYTLSGTWDSNVLTVFWGEEGKQGRSEYEFRENSMEAKDFFLTANGWKQFMLINYAPVADEE